MIPASIIQLIDTLGYLGLKQVVCSPGSRSAPLTLTVARHPQLRCTVANDERAAGYIALGMAQASQQAVAVIVTSGTAVLNLAPAVAEAYFLGVPLLVLSADRPPEWIAQQDGQTIHQAGVFGTHVKQQYTLPTEINLLDQVWHLNRLCHEAWFAAINGKKGPVHINVPIREPFYPAIDQVLIPESAPRIIQQVQSPKKLDKGAMQPFSEAWVKTAKKLIVVGQHLPDDQLANALYACAAYSHAPLLAEATSNMQHANGALKNFDLALGTLAEEQLATYQPELVLYIGESLMGKSLKQFLRKYPAAQFWYLNPNGQLIDALQQMTHWLPLEEEPFVTKLGETAYFNPNAAAEAWHNQWLKLEAESQAVLNEHLAQDTTELSAVHQWLNALPYGATVHLANSLAVRYVCWLGLPAAQKLSVYCNRGTSGIDGCTSTAVGHSLFSGEPVYLLSGEMAFHYDLNATWLGPDTAQPHVKALVLNNQGGAIFQMIDGPANQPEQATHFQSAHQQAYGPLAQAAGWQVAIETPQFSALSAALAADVPFQTERGLQAIIFQSEPSTNTLAFKALKQKLRQHWAQ